MRWMFLYWGRRGFSLYAHQIMRAAAALPGTETLVSVSRDNEEFDRFREFGNALWPVRLFSSGLGALTHLPRVAGLRREMRSRVQAGRLDAVVTLMPHVWSPLVAGAAMDAGARYATVVHDATAHPGDRTGLLHTLYARDGHRADDVVTLSSHVADALRAQRRLRPDARLHTLFHPAFETDRRPRQTFAGGRPLKLLSLGRIMAYKGMPLLAETLAELRRRGLAVELTVMGEGDLAEAGPRLDALGARIVNRWLNNDEIAEALASHDVLILTYTEASQSGVIPLAEGAGLPVLATDVGGLCEQVAHGETGLIAAPLAPALADAVEAIVTDPRRWGEMNAAIDRRLDARSSRRFVEELRAILAAAPTGR